MSLQAVVANQKRKALPGSPRSGISNASIPIQPVVIGHLFFVQRWGLPSEIEDVIQVGFTNTIPPEYFHSHWGLQSLPLEDVIGIQVGGTGAIAGAIAGANVQQQPQQNGEPRHNERSALNPNHTRHNERSNTLNTNHTRLAEAYNTTSLPSTQQQKKSSGRQQTSNPTAKAPNKEQTDTAPHGNDPRPCDWCEKDGTTPTAVGKYPATQRFDCVKGHVSCPGHHHIWGKKKDRIGVFCEECNEKNTKKSNDLRLNVADQKQAYRDAGLCPGVDQTKACGAVPLGQDPDCAIKYNYCRSCQERWDALVVQAAKLLSEHLRDVDLLKKPSTSLLKQMECSKILAEVNQCLTNDEKLFLLNEIFVYADTEYMRSEGHEHHPKFLREGVLRKGGKVIHFLQVSSPYDYNPSIELRFKLKIDDGEYEEVGLAELLNTLDDVLRESVMASFTTWDELRFRALYALGQRDVPCRFYNSERLAEKVIKLNKKTHIGLYAGGKRDIAHIGYYFNGVEGEEYPKVERSLITSGFKCHYDCEILAALHTDLIVPNLVTSQQTQ